MNDEHKASRELHQAYLEKVKALIPHQEYADRVARATGGGGQTPVEPLAVMGNNGGPLLCDICEKPIILEGGTFQGVYADAAWKKNPKKGWRSWISGGMIVYIEDNGTLRIYHGYEGRPGHCCTKAMEKDKKARASYDKTKGNGTLRPMLAYLEEEHSMLSESERDDLASKVCVAMFSYDSGLGINRPDEVNMKDLPPEE